MAGVREKLLTASDLATLCEVDLKTIHNWVDRGRIAHFRTPGRHLRFRAADVAEFLRAWGYSVPRELARASARTIMAVGTKDTVALVQRALGEGAVPAPPQAGQPAPAPTRTAAGAGAPPGEASAPKPPLRHASHPYDALVYAGSDPADVYVIDVQAIAADIDVTAMLEALHRASPQGTFVALSDEPVALPPFITRVARGEVTALRALLSPEGGGASAPPGASPQVKPPASGSSLSKASPTAIGQGSAVPQGHDDEEDETPPRSLAVGGSR
jgi:excisionase family DNA binding protein